MKLKRQNLSVKTLYIIDGNDIKEPKAFGKTLLKLVDTYQ